MRPSWGQARNSRPGEEREELLGGVAGKGRIPSRRSQMEGPSLTGESDLQYQVPGGGRKGYRGRKYPGVWQFGKSVCKEVRTPSFSWFLYYQMVYLFSSASFQPTEKPILLSCEEWQWHHLQDIV